MNFKTFKKHIPRFTKRFISASVSEWTSPAIMAQSVRWFIKLRWLAFVISSCSFVIGVLILGAVKEKSAFLPLAVCTLLIGIFNAVFMYIRKKLHAETIILMQIVSDLILLTLLFHFSGGAENPLFMVYIFHVIIAGILLAPRQAYMTAILVCVLFVSMVFLEFFHIVPHYPLTLFPHGESRQVCVSYDTAYVFTISSVFIVVMLLTAYFTISLAEAARYERKKERELSSQLMQAMRTSTIGELSAYIAHEINNPAGIITLIVKNLLSDHRDNIPQDVIAGLQEVNRQTQRITGIVHRLLGFIKPYSRKDLLIDVQSIIEESVRLVRPRLDSERIKLRIDIPKDLPLIKGNPIDLEQVIINLLNNAIDAMPQGGTLTITAHCIRTEKPPHLDWQMRIEVSDTGIGIPSEHMSNLFKPFWTTKGEKGTGLGLSICAALVKYHGGRIEVKSHPGILTTFTIILPVAHG